MGKSNINKPMSINAILNQSVLAEKYNMACITIPIRAITLKNIYTHNEGNPTKSLFKEAAILLRN